MRRMYISSLFRLENIKGKSQAGAVYAVDWDSKKLLTNVSPMKVTGECFLQPGKSHGARGITIFNNNLCVATSNDSIIFYDLDTFNEVKSINVDKQSALHQIRAHNGLLYICASGHNRLVVHDGNNVVKMETLNPQAKVFDSDISIKWKQTNHWPKDKLHFNSIGWDNAGDEYHLYFSCGVLYNYTKKRAVCISKKLKGAHDLCFVGRDCFISSSSKRLVLKVNLDTGELDVIFDLSMHELMEPPHKSGDVISMWGTTRGIVSCGRSLFVCRSPAKIYELDLDTHEYSVISTLELPTPHYECVYDIILDPRDW